MSERPVGSGRPRVSVLMPVFNGEALLRGAIDGILAQSLKDLELVVVDDGSTDGTAAILAEYRDPRVVRLRHERNRGLIAALTTGLAATRGDYVARQDADDVSLPDRFALQSDFLDAHADVSVVSSSSFFELEPGAPPSTRRVETDPLRIAWILLFSCPVAHSSVMFRRDVVAKLGGYRDGDVFAEDFGLWARIARFSKIGALDRPLVVRRRPEGSITAMHGAEMAEAARRISLENLGWMAGATVAAEDLDALQALCGNRPWSLDDALACDLSRRRLPEAIEHLLDAVWRNAAAAPARVRSAKRWARRWTAVAMMRRSHRLLTESVALSGPKRSAGLRLARHLARTALRISPAVLGRRKEAGIALRAMVGRA
jgi:hypothetical protein